MDRRRGMPTTVDAGEGPSTPRSWAVTACFSTSGNSERNEDALAGESALNEGRGGVTGRDGGGVPPSLSNAMLRAPVLAFPEAPEFLRAVELMFEENDSTDTKLDRRTVSAEDDNPTAKGFSEGENACRCTDCPGSRKKVPISGSSNTLAPRYCTHARGREKKGGGL